MHNRLANPWKQPFASLTASTATIERTCGWAVLAYGAMALCLSYPAILSLANTFIYEPLPINIPGSMGDGLGVYMMLIGGGTFATAAMTLLFAGGMMLRESRRASNGDVAATAARCGRATLCLALLPALPFLGYLLVAILPFKSLAPAYAMLFPVRGQPMITIYLAMAAKFTGVWLMLTFTSFLAPALELFLIWYAVVLLRLSRRLRRENPASADLSFKPSHNSIAASLQRRLTASNAAISRLCAFLCFLLAAVLVVPMAAYQAGYWLTQGAPTRFLSIWLGDANVTPPIIPALLTIAGHLALAFAAVKVGKRFWARAADVAAASDDSPVSSRFRNTLLCGGIAIFALTPIVYAFIRFNY